MKILKARNGIALIAVITIMLLTSLFIPVMFGMSDSSLAIAVKGTDRQRANYLARTVTEMCVASFTKIDTKKNNHQELASSEQSFINAIAALSDSKNANYNPYGEIKSTTIYMLTKTVDGEEDIVYESTESEKDARINAGYVLKGEASCTITFDGSVNYYKIYTADGRKEECFPVNNPNDPMNPDDLAIRELAYKNQIRVLDTDGNPKVDSDDKVLDGDYTKAVKNGTADYSLTKIENKNLIFTSTATVNGITAKKQCVVVMKATPSQDDCLVFGTPDLDNTGGNQLFVDPNKATAVVPIKYNQNIGMGMQNQPLLVYSCVGNMVIQPHNFLVSFPKPRVDGEEGYDSDKEEYYQNLRNLIANVDSDGDGRASAGNGGSTLKLGIQPGVNYGDNNVPSDEIDGVNYDYQQKEIQYNNFVAFAATNAIRVELPIDLMVNPCRTRVRFGDGPEQNASLFKIMIFQAPVIQFAGTTEMMMSFYNIDNARRMSSIVLTAPESTPYTYYNEDRGKSVKAGMVYFEQDCYLWIIKYGEDGEDWTSQTRYDKNSTIHPYKVANAGDVYYFNAEVPSINKDTGLEEKVGLSLTAYYIETKYATDPESTAGSFWKDTREDLFKAYLNQQDKMYKEDDLYYIGNLYEMGSVIEEPAVEDYYIVWTK